MTPELIKNSIKELELKKQECYSKIKSINQALDGIQAICDHKWKLDYTCGHKGEDYYVCEYCGKKQ